MTYQENIQRSTQLLRQAIPLMARQDAALHPISYAVWYEYVAGTNSALNQAVDNATRNDHRLDEAATLALYNEHIGAIDVAAARRLRDRFQELLQKTTSSATEASERATRFGVVLADWGSELETAPDAATALPGVRKVLEHTRELQEAVDTLQSRLEQSREEADRLRDELSRTREENLIDALTGLANRGGFDQGIRQYVGCDAPPRPLSLAMLDLDGFKEINDTHGHVAGDKALQIFGRLVRANVKGRDLAARFGGDEFTVLMPETQIDGAQALGEQIRRAVLGVELDTGQGTGARFRFTVSVGVTSYHRGESVEDFVKRADHALYLSKKRGRNCVTAFQ